MPEHRTKLSVSRSGREGAIAPRLGFSTKTIDYQHLKISCDRGFQATGLRG
jgi:hypothetical protein